MANQKTATKKAAKKSEPKKAAAPKKQTSAPKGSTAAYNTPSSKEKQKYGGSQAIPLEERENGGRIS